MAGTNTALVRATLEALYFTGAHRWLRPLFGGVGAILTMHHVRPARPDAFQPNRLLEITPDFLERVLLRLRAARIDLVSLDEMHRRLVERDFGRRFVCLTFDDGYRDNKTFAYPILKRFEAPFAIYVPTSFPDRLGDLWWLTLEAVVARNSRIGLVIDGQDRRFDCRTARQKWEVYDAIYWWLRGLPSEEEMRRAVRDLAKRHDVDPDAFCRDLCMDWNELAELAADPLVTIGAHSVNHVMLRKADEDVARSEMEMSAKVIETALGMRPTHFSYPVGDATSAGAREFALAARLGFKTAVTTRPGVLFGDHRAHLTALPRISLNGNFQRVRYMRALTSGVPTALYNRFRRVHAA
jgi:peptidoglycan/xylan/chitin deacetylase (PgdA/CDA1 family)